MTFTLLKIWTPVLLVTLLFSFTRITVVLTFPFKTHVTVCFRIISRWPGIKQGCLCANGSVRYEICCGQRGSNKKACCEGQMINPVSFKELEFWNLASPNSFDKIRLCAQRLKGYSFRLKSPTQIFCEETERECGGLGKGQENYLYCVP